MTGRSSSKHACVRLVLVCLRGCLYVYVYVRLSVAFGTSLLQKLLGVPKPMTLKPTNREPPMLNHVH